MCFKKKFPLVQGMSISANFTVTIKVTQQKDYNVLDDQREIYWEKEFIWYLVSMVCLWDDIKNWPL